ncbi:hypothetical protein VL15_35075 [Burkholderia cepacia]|uniref:Uncharacterized protein n=1 Tax=Burkholderia cepacia TaxID=292 RepID=A0A0J5WEQ5_BURCE|nr:hypothetical protein VL15_35075 [Burkholderia cepacia]
MNNDVQIQYFECGFVGFDADSSAVGILKSVVCRDPPVCRELEAQTVGFKELRMSQIRGCSGSWSKIVGV